MPTCWIEINRAALRHNFAQIQTLVGDQTRIIAVVKANAYGCGAPECARVFVDEGAQMLAVTRVDEALELRRAGIEAPILLLSNALVDEHETLIEHHLTASISSFDEAKSLNQLAEKMGETARVHLKINTGMNRFGAPPESVAEIVGRSNGLPNLFVDAAFTHFANASSTPETPTETQFETFTNATFGIKNLKFHVVNSSTLIRFPAMRLDFVRPGTLLYGQFPAPNIAQIGKGLNLELRDPFAARARIVAIQNLKKGEKFGYGFEWTAPRDSKLAILACGYADGLVMEPRARVESALDAIKGGIERAARLKKNPNLGRLVTVHGKKVPIVGRIAMQTCAVDVSFVDEARVGDEVTVPMRRLAAGQGLQRVYVE